jgi:hypothetical protein
VGETFFIGPERLAMMHLEQVRREAIEWKPKPRPVAPVAGVTVAPPPPPELRPIDKAVAFLREVLTPEPVPAVRVAEMAKNASIADRTLRRAFQKAGAQSFKRGGCWWWKLPDEEDDRQKGGRLRRKL